MKTIRDLEKIGFRNVGYWFINDKNKLSFIVLDNSDLQISHLLYSFESNSIVKYIGITESTLKKRLGNYKNGTTKKSGSTNIKVYDRIYDTISNGFKVNIWILKEDAPCEFHDYKISLATGIEMSLIKAFDLKETLWNSRGTGNVKPIKEIKGYDIKDMANNETLLKLGKFAREGWLIFKNDVDSILPFESTHMDIMFEKKVIRGCRFTRSYDNKKINGGYELKKIFENDFKDETHVKVLILGMNLVKIQKFDSQ